MIVTAEMSVSADGFYAGLRHTDMRTWLEGPEAAGFFRVTRWAIDAEAWRQRLGFRMRLLGPGLGLGTTEGIELTPARVIASPDVTHIRYTVSGRRPLVLDNRGRDEEPATA